MIESDRICKVISEGKCSILKIIIKLMDNQINKLIKSSKNM